MTILLTKLREFQYKLLHGVVYTKENLFEFGFVANNRCSFCEQSVETYKHLFRDCVYVKNLWQEVIDRFEMADLRNIEWRDVHFGVTGRAPKVKFYNTIIFILKYIIFRSRSEGKIPTFEEICKRIISFRDEEKEIAIKRNKLGLHLLKWENVSEMRA